MNITRLIELEDRMEKISSTLRAGDKTETYPKLLAETAKIAAEADYLLAVAKGEALDDIIKTRQPISANEQKVLTEQRCAQVIRLCRLADNTFKALSVIVNRKMV